MPHKKSVKQKKIKQKQKQKQNQQVIININTKKNKRVSNKPPSNNKAFPIPNNNNIPSLIVERQPQNINNPVANPIKQPENINNDLLRMLNQNQEHISNALLRRIEPIPQREPINVNVNNPPINIHTPPI